MPTHSIKQRNSLCRLSGAMFIQRQFVEFKSLQPQNTVFESSAILDCGNAACVLEHNWSPIVRQQISGLRSG